MLRPGSSRHEVIDSVVGHLTDAAATGFDSHFAPVYLLDERADGTMLVRMAAGAATAGAIDAAESSRGKGAPAARVPRWALQEDRDLASGDVLVHVARSWQAVIVGPLPIGGVIDRADVFTGTIPGASSWTEVPIVRSDGTRLATVAACLIGEGRETSFTLAGEVFEAGRHGELIRIFMPFRSDRGLPATGVLEVGYHPSYEPRPHWGQVEALRAAAALVAGAGGAARLDDEARRQAQTRERSAGVGKAAATAL